MGDDAVMLQLITICVGEAANYSINMHIKDSVAVFIDNCITLVDQQKLSSLYVFLNKKITMCDICEPDITKLYM